MAENHRTLGMEFDFTQSLTLQSGRAKLEPLLPIHFEALLPVATAVPDLVKYSPSLISTPSDLRKYIETAQEERKRKFRYAFAVYDKQHRRFAGSTSFANISNYDLRLEIGWTWIDRNLQGSGLNQHMKFLMLEFAFETLHFERVEFRTDARNIASRRAIEKIGGKYEGTLRSHTVMPDGFRRDTVYYSILKREWPSSPLFGMISHKK